METAEEALIVIDMQNGFLEPESPLCIAQAKATVPACAAVIDAAHAQGMPVFFVTRSYREDGTDVELSRKAAWEAGGKPLTPASTGALSADMPAAFAVLESDFRIVKPRFSAFFHTQLDLVLRRLGVSRVYLIGTTTPNCIRATCYDALSLDYRVCVIEDCCSSNTNAIQAANILDMRTVGASIVQSKDFIAR